MNARGLFWFKTLIYWSTRATGPIILVTVGITIRRVISAFLTSLLRFRKPLFELSHLFRQISHLSGISTSWLFPGLLKGLVGLSFWLPSLLNLRNSVVLWVVNGPSTALHHLQNLLVRPFLGVPFSGPPPCVRFPLLGTCSPAILVAVVTLALLARAASYLFTPRKWEVLQDVTTWY